MIAVLAGGCGLRQGEYFGLRVQDVDFLRRELHVRQQIKLVGHVPTPAPPKNGKSRVVPLPSWVGSAFAEHIAARPPMDGERTDGPGLGGLLFYTRERKPMNKDYFNSALWKPALAAAEVLRSRDNGLHALRTTARWRGSNTG